MIGRKLEKPTHVTVRKYVPLSEIAGMELPAEYAKPNWSYGRSNLPESDSADMLAREDLEADELARGSEMADMEAAQSREQQILEQIQDIIAQQAVHSRGVMDREGLALSLLDEAFAAPVQQQMAPRRFGMNMQQQPLNFDGMGFNQAFAAARRAGLRTFNWRGKPFTTQLKGERKWNAKRDK